MTKKYAIAGQSTKGRRSESVAVATPGGLVISAATRTVSTEKASEILKEEKGWNLSQVSIQRRCANGKWRQGVHWIKVGKQYLIHMDAVFESIADGTIDGTD